MLSVTPISIDKNKLLLSFIYNFKSIILPIFDLSIDMGGYKNDSRISELSTIFLWDLCFKSCALPSNYFLSVMDKVTHLCIFFKHFLR